MPNNQHNLLIKKHSRNHIEYVRASPIWHWFVLNSITFYVLFHITTNFLSQASQCVACKYVSIASNHPVRSTCDTMVLLTPIILSFFFFSQKKVWTFFDEFRLLHTQKAITFCLRFLFAFTTILFGWPIAMLSERLYDSKLNDTIFKSCGYADYMFLYRHWHFHFYMCVYCFFFAFFNQNQFIISIFFSFILKERLFRNKIKQDTHVQCTPMFS